MKIQNTMKVWRLATVSIEICVGGTFLGYLRATHVDMLNSQVGCIESYL